ncbi:MAG: ABC transporter permease [Anaerolineales bacterium]|nr:ABC transporter permease [Anaerolineales bacterium]
MTAFVAVTLTFFALRLGGGDPAANLMAQNLVSPEHLAAVRAALGLDQPLWVQYSSFLAGLVRGDLGVSLFNRRAVTTVIAEQLVPTLQLASASLLIAILLGLGLGILSAWSNNTLASRGAQLVGGLATGLPVALIGILAILLFSLTPLAALPGGGIQATRGLLLPALVLGFAFAGAIARVVNTELRRSRAEPYMSAAAARGIGRSPRLLWHALRPALPLVISLCALQAAHLFAGTVVIETVFSRPGVGRLLVSSILQGDYPVAQGLVVLAAVIYTLSHMAADLLALVADPRLRSSR